MDCDYFKSLRFDFLAVLMGSHISPSMQSCVVRSDGCRESVVRRQSLTVEVSLLWGQRADTTEDEKEPMSSYQVLHLKEMIPKHVKAWTAHMTRKCGDFPAIVTAPSVCIF